MPAAPDRRVTRGARYVAMGSSFGAGPGLRPRVQGSPRAAGRSAVNAAHLLAADLGLELSDVTFSGATIAQLRHGGPGSAEAQLAAVDASTALVTITGGGNDVGYLPGLTLSSLPAPLGALLGARRRLPDLLDAEAAQRRFEGLAVDLRALVDGIGQVAPRARIVLVGYLTILPPEGVPTPGLPDRIAGWGRATAAELRRVTADAAAATGATFLDVGAASIEHHAWSADPWTRRFHYSLRGGAPYHPDAAGMRAVAALLSEELQA